MKEYPAIFNTEMVKAILEGRKTMTRRAITKQNSIIGEGGNWDLLDFEGKSILSPHRQKIWNEGDYGSGYHAPLPWVDHWKPNWNYLHVPYNFAEEGTIYRVYPRWDIDDRLWVRETWNLIETIISPVPIADKIIYKASPETYKNYFGIHWRPSIFMPRWASRIDLAVTGIRTERLQEITEVDIEAEGFTSKDEFYTYWAFLYKGKKKYEKDKNPWVWIYEFEKEMPK